MHPQTHRRTRPRTAWLALLAAVAAAFLVTACGEDEPATSSAGNDVDLAFIDGMVEHHEGAIDMAVIAQERGESRFVRQLADDIVDAQQAEITVMERIRPNIASAGVEPADLGMSEDMMGMDMDMDELASATPFDRAFVDTMIPHHQGAIHMARMVLADGQSDALEQLAQDVITAQTREIEEMNAFREERYGAPSPAGGVPPEDEAPADGEAPAHSGH